MMAWGLSLRTLVNLTVNVSPLDMDGTSECSFSFRDLSRYPPLSNKRMNKKLVVGSGFTADVCGSFLDVAGSGSGHMIKGQEFK
jgi:hypothetical protein